MRLRGPKPLCPDISACRWDGSRRMAAHISPLISRVACRWKVHAGNTQYQRGLIVPRRAHSFRTRAGAAGMMRPAVSLKASRMKVAEESVISIVLVHGGFVGGSGW